jgi:MoxR-like ATPase
LSNELSPKDLMRLHDVRDRVKEDMKGIDGIINLLLIALIVRGHVLLEGNPGLGKTALIRALSSAMDLPEGDVGRIQFTPDLMPSDITGTKMPNDDGKLQFQKGPIFCRLLLADEINRATPKTQAAMLEAMAEFQVTVLGTQYPLSQEREVIDETRLTVRPPFMVMATQNSVEQEGTFALPEAQLDRFLFKALMPFPHRETLEAIVSKDAGLPKSKSNNEGQSPTSSDVAFANLHRLGRGLRSMRPSEDVRIHIMNTVLASVGMFDEMVGLSATALKDIKQFHAVRIRYELGPRAATSLSLATVGWAALAEVKPNEVSQIPAKSMDALAKIAVPVLRHRMRFEMDFAFGADQANKHDDLVREFVALCAPAEQGYAESFKISIAAAAESARF